jgi:small subunit ribosomal protein S20
LPRIKSAIKRTMISERNRKRNSAYKSSVRTATKKVTALLKDKTSELSAVKETFSKASGMLDKAVLKGVLHKNTVARYKSRLAKKLNAHAAANA